MLNNNLPKIEKLNNLKPNTLKHKRPPGSVSAKGVARPGPLVNYTLPGSTFSFETNCENRHLLYQLRKNRQNAKAWV